MTDGRTNERRRKVENRAVFCWTRNRNINDLVEAIRTMAIICFDREELLETSALSSAAPAVRISNNTRRSDLEPARYRHLHPHCHYFRYQGISYSSFACLQSVCSPKSSCSQVNPQKSLVCGESTVE